MKTIILGLSILSMSTFAGTTFNTVKVSDGKTAYCKSKIDLNSSKIGVYVAKATGASVEDETISFDIELKFLACVKNNESFNFVYKAPYEASKYETIRTTPGVDNQVTVTPQEVRLKAVKDGVYKVFSNQLLGNASKQTVNMNISLEDVLNQDQLNKLMDEGSVKGSFDVWIDKKMNYIIHQNDSEFMELVNYGSYRVLFEIINDEKELRIFLL